MSHPPKILSVFSLVMINVIAVDSLRTLPISASLGASLILYYLIAACAFFVPVALVAAELATKYPMTGGIYIWVREAFGKRAAFITIWLQWIYNVVWYPTILAFVAATLSYFISPALANNKFYLLGCTVGFFWLFTALNCLGMKTSSIISTIGACFGTILPMLIIIGMSILWVFSNKPIANDFSHALTPSVHSLNDLSLFCVILFGLIGIEMSAVHADDVKNPQKDYPRALLYSTILIISTLSLGSLAIVVVVPSSSLSVVSGLIDAYAIFFAEFNMPWMTHVTAALIILGALSSVSAWIIGPTKGLLVSARDGALPHLLAKTNKHDVPARILIIQAIIVTLLSTLFVFFDSINAAYWLLSDLCAQMALLVYVMMFAAAIRLRYLSPEKSGSYKIPGGNCLMWIISGVGLLTCLIAMFIGFLPPSQIPIHNIYLFESFLIGGLVLFVFIPWLLAKKH